MFKLLNCLINKSLELWENKFVVSATQSAALGLGSPRKETQVLLDFQQEAPRVGGLSLW